MEHDPDPEWPDGEQVPVGMVLPRLPEVLALPARTGVPREEGPADPRPADPVDNDTVSAIESVLEDRREPGRAGPRRYPGRLAGTGAVVAVLAVVGMFGPGWWTGDPAPGGTAASAQTGRWSGGTEQPVPTPGATSVAGSTSFPAQAHSSGSTAGGRTGGSSVGTVVEGAGEVSADPAGGSSTPATGSAKTSSAKASSAVKKGSSSTSGATTSGAAGATTDWGTTVIRGTSVLEPGQNWHTNRIRLTLTTGGNLVLTDENGRTTWSSGTSGSGTQLVFQADGNLGLYSGSTPLWTTRTDGHDGAILVLQADANVTISLNGTTLWSTGTAA